MLNLSDKELDRFSKEAAEEYEPGDVLGPRSWDRLEVRMTQEFGRPGWNPIRHIRRFPFYYAPALLFLMGVTYYLVRQGASSGSSPGATAKMPTQKTSVQPKNSVSADKNTSTPETNSEPVTAPSAGKGDGGGVAARKDGGADGGGGNGRADGAVKRGDGDGTGGDANAAGSRSDGKVDGVAGNGNAAGAGGNGTAGARGSGRNGAAGSGNAGSGAAGNEAGGKGVVGNVASGNAAAGNGAAGRTRAPLAGRGRGEKGTASAGDNTIAVTAPVNSGRGRNGRLGGRNGVAGSKDVAGVNGNAGVGNASPVAQERELTLSLVQGPHSLGRKRSISDSALRSFTAKSTLPTLIKGKSRGLEISRKWQFGLMIAPDFTSVNSLAGDKAGSSFGLTVDYNFAPHWYVSSGILATRKNYAARSQDYHAPPGFYQGAGIFGAVDFVKGSFYMMEIPLNLRYDFSVAGSTLFFISAGSSSYLMTSENANLYWRRGSSNLTYCNPTDHLKIKSANLFATVNLSAGVETGLSNSLSLVIDPYMKLPTKSLGFGQVQMSSVGINFGVKWSPVTSRKRIR